MPAHTLGAGLQLRGVQARVRFSNCKTGFFLPGNERRQHALLLFWRTEHGHWLQAKNVHVHSRRTGQARTGSSNGLHHHRRFGDAHAAAAVFNRQTNAQPAAIGQCAMQLVREAPRAIFFQPVMVVKPRANPAHGIANTGVLIRF